uniref:Uncharacterized protein n=1 Tax=Tanacetum cinerariifolium TaxID=118510 RepID=A0A6L2MGW1_TANCI|nr:hypothetical protein [Tanacetum cinerariifolium]
MWSSGSGVAVWAGAPRCLFVAGEGGRVFVGGSGSGGVGWKKGGSGVKGLAGKPVWKCYSARFKWVGKEYCWDFRDFTWTRVLGGCWEVMGKVVGVVKWSGEWRRWCCEEWQEKRFVMNSVFKNVGKEKYRWFFFWVLHS